MPWHPPPGPHRGHLRRDRRGHDHRHAGKAGRRRCGPPRRAGRGLCHRHRPEDHRCRGIRLLARTEGIFAETAGGTTIATLAKLAAEGVVRPDERVVAYVTGIGLKTIDAVSSVVGPTATIAPTLDAFNAVLE